MNDNYKKNGVWIVRDVLTDDEVQSYRDILDEYLDNNPSYCQSEDSKILPGFADITPDIGPVNTLHLDDRVLNNLREHIFDDEFIFADHSDLHQNKITGWHRDTLDFLGKDRGAGRYEDCWSEECHIIKVCFLLQDHTDNDYGLWFKPGTHMKEIDGKPIIAHTKSTDMIIFNQRIWHACQTQHPRYHKKMNRNRYLLTYAYGSDNEHTQTHRKGSTLRQNRQRNEFSFPSQL